MNGSGIKGGAFGFRVSSINKVRSESCIHLIVQFIATLQLVDTKSVNNTTLLHFLERTVAKHFPEMESFLDELDAPAEAYRGMSVLPSTINVPLITIRPSELARRSERSFRNARRAQANSNGAWGALHGRRNSSTGRSLC